MMFSDLHFINLLNGKTLLMVDGYTFHKVETLYTLSSRWKCSKKPKCGAFIVLAKDEQKIIKQKLNHNHEKPKYAVTPAGLYIKI